MGILIDSSSLIAAGRGDLDLDAILDDQRDPGASNAEQDVAVAAVTAAELLHGVHRLKGVDRARTALFVEAVLKRVRVVPFDIEIARIHAMLSADLRSKGTTVGAHDLMIAATAVFLDYDVATRDLHSFGRIRGVRVRGW
jgi:predicted nucleic acid-binding protein